MALIDCEDCGRKVSDLAVACPQCARPIAAERDARALAASRQRAAAAAAAETPSGAGGEPLPASLAEWQEQLRVARASAQAPAKRCVTCDVDVALDAFRARSGDAYVCGDCRDVVVRRQLARELLVRRILVSVSLFALLALVMGTALYIGAGALQAATLRSRSVNKR